MQKLIKLRFVDNLLLLPSRALTHFWPGDRNAFDDILDARRPLSLRSKPVKHSTLAQFDLTFNLVDSLSLAVVKQRNFQFDNDCSTANFDVVVKSAGEEARYVAEELPSVVAN